MAENLGGVREKVDLHVDCSLSFLLNHWSMLPWRFFPVTCVFKRSIRPTDFTMSLKITNPEIAVSIVLISWADTRRSWMGESLGVFNGVAYHRLLVMGKLAWCMIWDDLQGCQYWWFESQPRDSVETLTLKMFPRSMWEDTEMVRCKLQNN